MVGLKIEDSYSEMFNNELTEYLAFDLYDILDVIKEKVKSSYWDVNISNYNPNEKNEKESILPEIIGKKVRISGEQLIGVSKYIMQVFDGYFYGLFNNENEYWIRIAVIDGEFWIVQCKDTQILNLYKDRFHQIEEIDEEPLELIY